MEKTIKKDQNWSIHNKWYILNLHLVYIEYFISIL